MDLNSEKLRRLGLTDWFKSKTSAEKMLQHELARVIAVHRDSYLINKGGTDVFAEPIGKLIYGADSPLDLPTTGDWVYADF